MEGETAFAGVLMHPGLFPGLLLDFANPPRTKVSAEIHSDKLSFLPHNRSVPFGDIDSVIVQHLSAQSQLGELLQKTVVRIFILAAFLAICQLGSSLGQSSGPLLSILIALAVATVVSGPLFFVRNGGLEIKGDVVRFRFLPTKQAKAFYLEVGPTQERAVSQALLSVGLRLSSSGDEETRGCDHCGAIVSSKAIVCPACGVKLDE
jgi:hypothetical protein